MLFRSVLLDEPPRRTRPPRPRDPNWKPDLILHDDPAFDGQPGSAPADAARKTYRTLFQRISAESVEKDPAAQFGWIHAIGILIVLMMVILLCSTLYSAISTSDQQTEPLERPIYYPTVQ